MFVVMSKNRQITGHYSEFFDARAFWRMMNFYKYSVAHRVVTGISHLGNQTRKNAGPSREWRPKGAPTTDEVLLVLL